MTSHHISIVAVVVVAFALLSRHGSAQSVTEQIPLGTLNLKILLHIALKGVAIVKELGHL